MATARYQPPFTLTHDIVSRVANIAERVGRLSVTAVSARDLRLRRINRIRTITGSLAIEGSTLTEAQITAILDGKPVLAPPRELQEARNALAAYEQLPQWQGRNEADLWNPVFVDEAVAKATAGVIEKTTVKKTRKATEKALKKTPDAVQALLAGNPQLTAHALAAELGKAELTIHRALRKLREAGRLRRIGPDKGGHWEVIEP